MLAKRSFGTKQSITLLGALLATTAFTVPAYAQIETVIVQAEKRSENLQAVPIAVTAISGDDLKQKEIVQFKDLQFNVPNLTYSKTGLGNGTVTIRGIGQAAGDPGVAQYEDGIYSETQDLATGHYFDLESVQVLRGPQGTLYGRGSVGGTVNVVSAKPDLDTFMMKGNATYGNYSQERGDGAINIPLISGVLGARLAGEYTKHDGFTQNLGPGGDYNGQNDYGVRGSLRWQPNERTTVDFVANYFHEFDTRTRGDNTLCARDDSGVLGCLPDSLALEPVNAYAGTSALAASKQFFNANGVTVGQAFGGILFGTAGPVAEATALNTFGFITAGQLAALTAANAGAPTAANVGTVAGVLGLGLGAVAQQGALFDVTNFNGPGSGASTASLIPNNIQKIYASVTPQFHEQGFNGSMHFHHSINDWLETDVLIGHSEGKRRTESSYDDQPDENIQAAINTAVPTLLATLPLFPGNSAARIAALQATYFSTTGAGGILLPWSNPVPGGIANNVVGGGINSYINTESVLDVESSTGQESSMEWRFSSNFTGPLNFTAGAFYWSRRSSPADYRVTFTGGDYAALFLGNTVGTLSQLFGVTPGSLTTPLVGQDPMYYQNAPSAATSKAGFVDFTYEAIPDVLTFRAGVRWSEDQDSLVGNHSSFVSLNGAGAADCFGGSYCFVQPNTDQAAVIAASVAHYVPEAPTSKDTSLFNYRAVAEWHPTLGFTDDTHIYASLAEASKPGNLNLVPATVPVGAIPATFSPEELTSMEVGAKNTLLDGTLQANLTGWFYDYKNFQYTSIAYSTLYTQNLDAHMWGGEAELLWQPDDHWSFNANLTLSASRIGNNFAIDQRNATNNMPGAVYIKDDNLNAAGDFPADHCVIVSTTGISPGEDPALNALPGGNPFAVPGGVGTAHDRATQDASHGVPFVNFGSCTVTQFTPWINNPADPTGPQIMNPGYVPALGYRYVNSHDDGPHDNISGYARSLKGNSVPGLPQRTVNVGAQYSFDFDGGYTLVPRVDYFWQSGYNSRVFNDAVDNVGAWDQVNVQIQLNAPDQGWYLKAFSTNLMDKHNIQGKGLASDTSGLFTTVFLEDPRTFGLTLGAQW